MSAPVPPVRLLDAREVAELLRCNADTVKSLARKGHLAGSKIAGRWLFAPESVTEYVAHRSNIAPPRRRRKRLMAGESR